MKHRTRELARRRAALQARCATQRAQLGEISGELQFQLRFIDRGIDLARRATAAPMLIVIALAALTFVGPSGVVRWISRALLVATAVRRLTGAHQHIN
ncbi:MAG TPA: YqjK family protein [Steroidobacteraceae bacterium]